MPQFFIDRPVFAWVTALFIVLAGLLTINRLPIAQFPTVAPPSVQIISTYPGASPEIVDESVTSLIEEALNGATGLMYVESESNVYGRSMITATFDPGTDADLAQVDVQNRIKTIEARLPQPVRAQGVLIDKANTSILLVIGLSSDNPQHNSVALGDYLQRNVINEIKRVPGVGRAILYSSERAMRVWIDPDKLVGLGLSPSDVTGAIASQNAQVTSGSIGEQPSPQGQTITASVIVKGQMSTPEEFGEILLRANADGSKVRLRDVARVEVAAQSFQFTSRMNGKPAAALAVQLAPGANAISTADGVKARLDELSRYFPDGMSYDIPYNTTPFVKLSIEKVTHTLIEAMVLVFLVMFLFLQNWRYTLIPTIVVPIALLGTFAVMLPLGFSINVLTMFGMVLAIGILVDDAIVVVENVERLMVEEGLSPKEATRKAMTQISGAIIGITLVLVAVFLPMAFMSGSVGAIYRQFSLTMAVSILFSAFLALSLTPALCATLLKPIAKGHHAAARKGFFGWFNRNLAKTTDRYDGAVRRSLRKTGRMLLVYGALVGVMVLLFVRLPSSFLPIEDQGYIITDIQLPPGATASRTGEVIDQLDHHYLSRQSVDKTMTILGFSLSGMGQNAAVSFTSFKDWSERGEGGGAEEEAMLANKVFSKIRDASLFSLAPPAIPELGNAAGFSFRLQDRSGVGHDALVAARDRLLDLASKSPVLTGMRVEGLDDGARLQISIDRQKASAMGLSFAQINAALSTALGSAYVNDFPNLGRMQQVIVQAEARQRMQLEDIMALYVRNDQGGMVPFSAFASGRWEKGPIQLMRYNNFPAFKIGGNAAPGYSTGEAMNEMERLMEQMPNGIGYAWTGQSLQEKLSGSQAPALLALSMLVVFLLLAALYESWAIPFAVMLVVPLGVIGSVLAVTLRGMPNDVFFKVGLITIIGLSAKNAVLIIEFAKDLHAEGKGLVESAVEAARLRFRPILMTSIAFIFGVIPLAIATGASSASQQAIGTGVVGGMLTATVLAVFFVPVFFVVVLGAVQRWKRRGSRRAQAALPAGVGESHGV